MTDNQPISLRPARVEDARPLAQLIDIAGEGIPHWLWQQTCEERQMPLDIGESRAKRLTGGFSYTNSIVAEDERGIPGMVLSYPIIAAPEDDPEALPAPLIPFVMLETQSVDSWYINALAVFPGNRGKGIGASLLAAAEDKARAQGYREVTIQVFEQNVGAVRLYRRSGYVERARSPVRFHPCQPYYTGDVLLLEKPLGTRSNLENRHR